MSVTDFVDEVLREAGRLLLDLQAGSASSASRKTGTDLVTAADHASEAVILRALRTGFPDIRYTVDAVHAVGDTVLIRWTGRGTHTGPFLGFPPSGVAVDWSGMNAFRFACGVIVEGWSEANGLQVLRQIGALP